MQRKESPSSSSPCSSSPCSSSKFPYIIICGNKESDINEFMNELNKITKLHKITSSPPPSIILSKSIYPFVYKGILKLNTKYYSTEVALYTITVEALRRAGDISDGGAAAASIYYITTEQLPEGFVYIFDGDEEGGAVEVMNMCDEFEEISLKMMMMKGEGGGDIFEMDIPIVKWAINEFVEVIQWGGGGCEEGGGGGCGRESFGLLSNEAKGVHRFIEVLECHRWPNSLMKCEFNKRSDVYMNGKTRMVTSTKTEECVRDTSRCEVDMRLEKSIESKVIDNTVNEDPSKSTVVKMSSLAGVDEENFDFSQMASYIQVMRQKAIKLPDDERRKLAEDVINQLCPYFFEDEEGCSVDSDEER